MPRRLITRAPLLVASALGALVGVLPGCGSDGADTPTDVEPAGSGAGGSSAGAAGAAGEGPGAGTGGVPTSGGSGGTSAGGGAGGDAPAGGAPPVATCDSGSTDPAAVCVTAVVGRVVDEAGAPLSDFLVTACGPERCDPATTDADGHFRIPVGFRLVPARYSVLAHGRPERAAFYFQLPVDAAGPEIDVGTLPQLPLPPSGPAIDTDRAGAPAQQLTSGEVTLETPEASVVRVDVESATFGDIGTQLRALRLPEGARSDYGIDAGVTAVYGFEPFEARIETPDTRVPLTFRLRFDNVDGLAPNDSVEILALGTFVYPDWLTPAVFEPAAIAHVTLDGTAIEMDPGEGLRYLTWVALRPVP